MKKLFITTLALAFMLSASPSSMAFPFKFFGGSSAEKEMPSKFFGGGEREIPEDIREQLDELRAAKESGDTEEAEAILEELKEEREAKKEEMKEELDEVIEEGYDAWVEFITEKKGEDAAILEKITEDNFDTFVELHEAKQLVEELKEELGLDEIVKEKRGWGRK